jgi:hypothetical protein
MSRERERRESIQSHEVVEGRRRRGRRTCIRSLLAVY